MSYDALNVLNYVLVCIVTLFCQYTDMGGCEELLLTRLGGITWMTELFL